MGKGYVKRRIGGLSGANRHLDLPMRFSSKQVEEKYVEWRPAAFPGSITPMRPGDFFVFMIP